MRTGSPSSRADRSRRRYGLGALAAAAVVAAVACGEGASTPGPPAAVIVVQPADEAVFEGQAGTFQVRASGTEGLTYQWRRDGVPIAGATDSHLVTDATVPGDDGATYSVAVTNGGASPVESRAAVLGVLPPLDLRFQWVGAPYRPSYSWAMGLIPGLTVTSLGTGSPVRIRGWFCYVDPTVPGMTIAYHTDPIAALAGSWAQGIPPDTVVTSLDVDEAYGAYAMTLSRTTQAGEFAPVVQGSVSLDQLQAAATAEGANGRVLTAVWSQGGLASYVSYGWSRAPSTVYEARVVATTPDAVAAEAAGLAAEGYAITAFGAGGQAANGLVLVGTRVQGATTARSVMFVPEGAAYPEIPGYAIVGHFYDPVAVTWSLVAER